MNKVLKRTTIVMLILLGVGIVFLIIGKLLGGSFYYAVDMKNHKMYVPKSGEEYISKTLDVDAFQSMNVQLNSADIEIKQGDSYRVDYHFHTWNEPVVKVENDTLIISDTEEKMVQVGWDFDIFGIIKIQTNRRDEPEKIVVTVPEEGIVESLELKNSYGDLYIENIQINDYNITAESGSLTLADTRIDSGVLWAEYGDIDWEHVEGKQCVITVENGDCTFENVQMDNLSLDAEYGDIDFMGSEVNTLIVKADSGEIAMEQLSGNRVDIEVEYGNLLIGNSTIDNISANCESGEVDVKLNGATKDYDFDITVETGDLEINGKEESNTYKDKSGRGKSITIQSEYGDVDIAFQ